VIWQFRHRNFVHRLRILHDTAKRVRDVGTEKGT
jgi:hypothetical protein